MKRGTLGSSGPSVPALGPGSMDMRNADGLADDADPIVAVRSDDGPAIPTCHASAASLRHYLKDVSIAARAFGQALCAFRGRQFVAQEVRNANTISLRAKTDGRRRLFWLAHEQDAISPALAAELRTVAARA